MKYKPPQMDNYLLSQIKIYQNHSELQKVQIIGMVSTLLLIGHLYHPLTSFILDYMILPLIFFILGSVLFQLKSRKYFYENRVLKKFLDQQQIFLFLFQILNVINFVIVVQQKIDSDIFCKKFMFLMTFSMTNLIVNFSQTQSNQKQALIITIFVFFTSIMIGLEQIQIIPLLISLTIGVFVILDKIRQKSFIQKLFLKSKEKEWIHQQFLIFDKIYPGMIFNYQQCIDMKLEEQEIMLFQDISQIQSDVKTRMQNFNLNYMNLKAQQNCIEDENLTENILKSIMIDNQLSLENLLNMNDAQITEQIQQMKHENMSLSVNDQYIEFKCYINKDIIQYIFKPEFIKKNFIDDGLENYYFNTKFISYQFQNHKNFVFILEPNEQSSSIDYNMVNNTYQKQKEIQRFQFINEQQEVDMKLKQPLRSVQMNLQIAFEMLKSVSTSNSIYDKLSKYMVNCSNYLMMVDNYTDNQISNFEIQNDIHTQNLSQFHLESQINQIKKELQVNKVQNSSEIRIKYNGKSVDFYSDRTKVKLIFYNIIRFFQFFFQKSNIIIRIQDEDERFQISIELSGEFINPNFSYQNLIDIMMVQRKNKKDLQRYQQINNAFYYICLLDRKSKINLIQGMQELELKFSLLKNVKNIDNSVLSDLRYQVFESQGIYPFQQIQVQNPSLTLIPKLKSNIHNVLIVDSSDQNMQNIRMVLSVSTKDIQVTQTTQSTNIINIIQDQSIQLVIINKSLADNFRIQIKTNPKLEKSLNVLVYNSTESKQEVSQNLVFRSLNINHPNFQKRLIESINEFEIKQ